MSWIITKYFITAGMVVLISELAKRSEKLGGFVAALPLVTLLTLTWMHLEQQPASKIANYSWYTFWYVIPTLPMCLLFPWLLHRFGFWPSMFMSILFTVIVFGLYSMLVKRWGIELI